ncbi:MAG: MMPL family transporter [Candidatus Aminicenantes bacterium]|nr:MMPL family transporter [Candidatus Aminicenantes bacterium]
MRAWVKFITRRPWIIILFTILLSLFFVYEMKNLRFENRFTEWMPKSDPVLKTFLETGEKFGINELVMVAIKAKKGETFSPEILERVKKLTEALKEKKEIFLVTSITNSPDIRNIDGGIEVRDLIEDIPEDPRELQSLKRYILSKETFVNNVISSDGKWLAMAIYLRTDEKSDPIKNFGEVVKPTVEKYLGDVAEIYYTGEPCDAYFANEFSVGDLKKLTPLVAILIILVLLLSFKTWKGVFYPSLVVILSTIWTFGTMGSLHIPMDILTPVLPVLLIALGSAYGIHVMNKIFHEDSVEKATISVFVPVLMAGLTTIVGFLSFATAKLSLIVNLAIFSAIGIFYSMAIALSLIPAMAVISRKKEDLREEKYGYSILLRPLSKIVMSSKWLVTAVFFLIFLFFVIWVPRIHREVNFAEYYPENSIPRKSLNIVKEHFGGAYPVTLYIKADNVKEAGILKLIRMNENYLYSIEGTSIPFSIADFIQEMNYQLNGRYHIPVTAGEVANLWFFIEGRPELSQIVTPDYSESLIFAKIPESRTSFLRKISQQLVNFVKKYGSGFEAYELANFKDERVTQIREKESELIEQELRWLGKRYGVKIKKGIFAGITDKIPAVNDPEVLKHFRAEIEKQVFSEDFDFQITRKQARKILNEIINSVKRGDLRKEKITEILKANVSSNEWDEEIARDVASAFLYRLDEARAAVFIERAWEGLALEGTDPDFQKKAKGLLWELSDGLAVLPTGALPFRGKKIDIRKIEQSGFPVAMTRLDHFLYVSQLQSLLIALLLTFILMVILRKSISIGAIATTPIIFTLGVIYGFLGLSGIPLTYATMLIAGVSIGVGIDYAIHFIHGVFHEMEEGYSLREAIEITYVEKGKAILSNSIAVILGFAVLLFSKLKPLHNFGGTMMGSMFLAALAALTFLPALLLILLDTNKNKRR